jgi:hypothetical protein
VARRDRSLTPANNFTYSLLFFRDKLKNGTIKGTIEGIAYGTEN